MNSVVLLSLVATFARTRNSLELVFCDTLAHGSGTGHTTRDHLKQLVNVVGTRPFLVLENLDAHLRNTLVTDLKARDWEEENELTASSLLWMVSP